MDPLFVLLSEFIKHCSCCGKLPECNVNSLLGMFGLIRSGDFNHFAFKRGRELDDW